MVEARWNGTLIASSDDIGRVYNRMGKQPTKFPETRTF